MSRLIRVVSTVFLVVFPALAFLVFPALAFGRITNLGGDEVRLAYLDPGAGSFMIQALVAALAGIAVTARLYWTKIKSMLGLTTVDDEDLDDDDE